MFVAAVSSEPVGGELLESNRRLSLLEVHADVADGGLDARL